MPRIACIRHSRTSSPYTRGRKKLTKTNWNISTLLLRCWTKLERQEWVLKRSWSSISWRGAWVQKTHQTLKSHKQMLKRDIMIWCSCVEQIGSSTGISSRISTIILYFMCFGVNIDIWIEPEILLDLLEITARCSVFLRVVGAYVCLNYNYYTCKCLYSIIQKKSHWLCIEINI